jgi:hypothetical protein
MDDQLQPLMTVYLSQMDSAMMISDTLAKHNGDTKITPDALISGLIYRLMVPMTDDELQSSMNAGNEMMEKIMEPYGYDDEDEEEEPTVPLVPLESTGSYEPRTLVRNTCNCDICAKTRACLANYKIYESSDPLAEIFHKAIKHACDTHGLLID